jgi:transcriptional regulator with XRE-family HTH domain
MPDFDEYVGLVVQTARRRAGFSVNRLAAALGVTNIELHEIEAGSRRITSTQVLAAARALRVPCSLFDVPFDQGVRPTLH